MSGRLPRIRSFHIHLAAEPSQAASFRIQALARNLVKAAPKGLTDVVPGYTNILVEFDAAMTTEQRLRRAADEAVQAGSAQAGRRVRIPVRYDGPDLESAAAALNMGVDELVRRHSAAEYLVHAIGFTPGFPFMGMLEPGLRLPRRDQPRPAVPANSVAMADGQTGIYPQETPGGWHLLGTALQPVYRPGADKPFLLEPGDTVRFEPADGPDPAEAKVLELLPEEPEMPFLRVHKAGLLDIIVDAGRTMLGRYGLARSGPMDPLAASISNRLLGNEPFAPLLEINVSGPVLEVLRAGTVAFGGWGVDIQLGKERLAPFTSHRVRAGDTLRFPAGTPGSRSYLAVAGGFEVEPYQGSASTDLKGMVGRPLRDGDVLGAGSSRPVVAGRSFVPYSTPEGTWRIRLLKGPQFNADAATALTTGTFHVATGNRMGIQLDGPEVPGAQVVSEGNPMGAVQVTPGGRPIILMNDRGTIGGYAKPAVVHPNDLRRVAQLRQHQPVRFVFVECR